MDQEEIERLLANVADRQRRDEEQRLVDAVVPSLPLLPETVDTQWEFKLEPSVIVDDIEITRVKLRRSVTVNPSDDSERDPFFDVLAYGYRVTKTGARHRSVAPGWFPLPRANGLKRALTHAVGEHVDESEEKS